jgi:hypothetical protein
MSDRNIEKIVNRAEHRLAAKGKGLGHVKVYDEGGVVGDDNDDLGIAAGRKAAAQGDTNIEALLNSSEPDAVLNSGTSTPTGSMAGAGAALGKGISALRNQDHAAAPEWMPATNDQLNPDAGPAPQLNFAPQAMPVLDKGGVVRKVPSMQRIQNAQSGHTPMRVYDEGGEITPEQALSDGEHVPAILKVGERVVPAPEDRVPADADTRGPRPQAQTTPDTSYAGAQIPEREDRLSPAQRTAVDTDTKKAIGSGNLVKLGMAKIAEQHAPDELNQGNQGPGQGMEQGAAQPAALAPPKGPGYPQMTIPGLSAPTPDAIAPRAAVVPESYKTQIAELDKAQKDAMHAYGLSGDPADREKADAAAYAKENLKRNTPWGSAENHPGFMGKLGHVAGEAGNTLGNIVSPSIMGAIPGTAMNRALQAKNTLGRIEKETPEVTARMDAEAKETKAIPLDQQYATASAEYRAAQEKGDVAGAKAAQSRMDDAKAGMMAGKVEPKDTELPQQYLDAENALDKATKANDQAGMAAAQQTMANVQKAINAKDSATAKPLSEATVNSTNQALADRHQILNPGKPLPPEFTLQPNATQADYERIDKLMEATEKAQGTKTQQQTNEIDKAKLAAARLTAASVSASRKDIATHELKYVQPANAIEKSYEMMDSAYKEYEALDKQGKEFPTGAQSMMALSTHLTTTFGNVKGSRITKDMIQEHLHARSISDDAEVAFNKLRNGDKLSKGQWEAFHELVSESRQLSWDTAVREADRKNIPTDFLPNGLTAVKAKGMKAGVIPTTNVAAFQKKYPDADVADAQGNF